MRNGIVRDLLPYILEHPYKLFSNGGGAYVYHDPTVAWKNKLVYCYNLGEGDREIHEQAYGAIYMMVFETDDYYKPLEDYEWEGPDA